MLGKTNAGGMFPSFPILKPNGWESGYTPTTTGNATVINPSNASNFRISYTGRSYGLTNFSWGNNVQGKRARIYYRAYCNNTGAYFEYIYNGITTRFIPYSSNVNYGGVIEVEDLSMLSAIQCANSQASGTPTWIDFSVIEII